jgi:predicted peptidase
MKATGQKITSIAVEYEKELLAPKLALNSFSVMIDLNNAGNYGEIPISEIYTSASPDGTAPEKGKFVIIKFRYWEDSGEAGGYAYNAGTSFYDGSTTQARSLNSLRVVQTRDLLYDDWVRIPRANTYIPQRAATNLIVDDFKVGTFQGLSYRLFTPARQSGKKYPLILFLHGGGEVGNSNITQITANSGATIWATPENQAKNPAFVLAPQVPQNSNGAWADPNAEAATIGLIEDLIASEAVDPNKIHVQGMSLGGQGTWSFITKHPAMFASAMPICGAVDWTALSIEQLKTILDPVKKLPISIFAAADDPTLSVQNSRDAYQALHELGSPATYLEFPVNYAGIHSPRNDPARGHRSWEAVYFDQGAIDWLAASAQSSSGSGGGGGGGCDAGSFAIAGLAALLLGAAKLRGRRG